MKRVKHSVTHEISAAVNPADLAQALLGDRFDPNAAVVVQFVTTQGAGKVENLLELVVTQFVREEREPVEKGGRT